MRNTYILLALCFLYCCSPVHKEQDKKIIVAHRGASGYLPEHTMASKAMAYAMQPDYIEQDVVLSKDNIPVVIHDIRLDDVSDVHDKFPDRKRADGHFYVIDFDFEELQTLAITERFDVITKQQRYPNRFTKGKSSFRLHSLAEEIELIQGLNRSTGNHIGIYPEIKKPAFHHKEGRDISTIVLHVLTTYGYTSKEDKCMLQCFDAKELQRIREVLHSDLFLVQLIELEDQSKNLTQYASYANGIGPWYKQLLANKEGATFRFTPLVADAHELGLQVHPYTFRVDALDEFSSFQEMVDVLLYQAGADGGFTDFPDAMRALLKK